MTLKKFKLVNLTWCGFIPHQFFERKKNDKPK